LRTPSSEGHEGQMTAVSTRLARGEDLEELRSVLREFLAAKAPVRRTLEQMESRDGYDRAVWRQMCDQLALPALTVPERLGGQGFGFFELATVLEELGRVAYLGPVFATALATQALLRCADTQFLPEIAAGAITATLCLHEPGRGWEINEPVTTATRAGSSFRLTGTKAWVLDGATAELLLVSAGNSLFAVEGDDPGVSAVALQALDLTRPVATITLDGAQGLRVGSLDAAEEAIGYALAGLACEQAGGAQACLEMTVRYAAERIQFGRPIGSYQAVRHQCADMFVLAETARSTAHHAARAVAAQKPDADIAVAVAKSYCSEAFLRIAESTIQLHGGIGFTWEHPAHVYFKRAKASALLFGDPAEHRARIAPALLTPVGGPGR
jgi:alkylation response protein AidB-like acyl-CoA dehydrogenase